MLIAPPLHGKGNEGLGLCGVEIATAFGLAMTGRDELRSLFAPSLRGQRSNLLEWGFEL